MHLNRLKLSSFRLYEEAEWSFSPGINLIYGRNALGKTTILESVYYLICGRSFRTKHSSELCRKGGGQFCAEGLFTKCFVDQKLKITYCQKERLIVHNRTELPSATALLGIFNGVIMAPDDAAIVGGAPSFRRRYLDIQLAQANPLYVHHLSRYYKALKQRNALLKSKSLATIDTWEHELAKSAAYLHLQRAHLIEELSIIASAIYRALSGENVTLHLTYAPTKEKFDDEANLFHYYAHQYERMRVREMSFGITLYGPHKDDIAIAIGDLDARTYASEGQVRCCILALRLAEWKRLSRHVGEHPLLLLDDVGTFLDSERKERLLSSLSEYGQVIMTSTQDLKLPGQSHKLQLY